MPYAEYDDSNYKEIRDLLIGRSIVDVENDMIVLDDGTELVIVPNPGCSGCGSGEYILHFIREVENVITNVEFNEEEMHNGTFYSIVLYTEGVANQSGTVLMNVSGSDGNGFYGSGYRIHVTKA